MTQKIRTRIAPSPTGDPHVGTGYIALFNYAYATQKGGEFILRIEDTDQARCSKESEEAIYESLKWLGITWSEGPDCGGDFGPYRQSERTDIYKKHIQILLDKKAAYKCTCTSERLATLRKKQEEEKSPFRGYDGYCKKRDQAEVAAEIENGASFVIRLNTADTGMTIVEDVLRGEIEIQNKETDDQVLMKSDGFPTYHLASVVDDHLMQISHVIRGEEWIKSTAKHLMLYKAFGWQAPTFAHLPLLRNKDKSKVSKRKNPVSISYYKEAGYFADAFLNFLGHMAFTFKDERDIFSLQEFVNEFELSRVSLGAPIFDVEKLLWINSMYLREHRSTAEVVAYLKEQLFSDDYLAKIVPLVQQRIDKSEDFVAYADFFFSGVPNWQDPSIFLLKGFTKKESGQIIVELAEVYDRLLDWNKENIEAKTKEFCELKEMKARVLFMPIRIMVTGKKASPDLFSTMEVLGRERCRTRIRAAADVLKKLKV